MKKFSFYLLATVLSALFFTACNDDDDSPSGPGTFTNVIVDGKGVSNGDNIPLNKGAFSLSWVIDKGSSDIKSLKIEVNNKVVTDGNDVVWNGTSSGSQAIANQLTQWVNTISLAIPNDNLRGLYNYTLTLTNAAGESTTFNFTLSYSEAAFPGSPALAIKLNDKVAYNGIKYAVGDDKFTLSWHAIKGIENLQSIQIEHNDEFIADVDGFYWDGNTPESTATEEQFDAWKNSINIFFEIGLYKITITDAGGLSRSIEFEITRKTENDIYGLAGSEWDLTNCTATILAKTFSYDENGNEVLVADNIVMTEDQNFWREEELLLPHFVKFERMNEEFSYSIDGTSEKGRYSFSADGKVITCNFDDNVKKYIFTRNGNTITREVDIIALMPSIEQIEQSDPEAPTIWLEYTKAKLTYTYTKR
jgi:hypothetical protein